MAEFDLQGTVGLVFLGFLFYIWCKYRKPGDGSSYNGNNNDTYVSKNTYYRARSLYHSSGMLHTNLGDCWKECRDLEAQYPGEAFSPETVRQ